MALTLLDTMKPVRPMHTPITMVIIIRSAVSLNLRQLRPDKLRPTARNQEPTRLHTSPPFAPPPLPPPLPLLLLVCELPE